MLLHHLQHVLLLFLRVGDDTVEGLYQYHTTLRYIVHHLQPSQHLLSFNVDLIIYPCARIENEEVMGDVKSSEQSSGVLRHKVTKLFHLYVCCSENNAPMMVWLSGFSQTCNHCCLHLDWHIGIKECKLNQNFIQIP